MWSRSRSAALFFAFLISGASFSTEPRPSIDPKICELGLIKPIFLPLPMRDRVYLIKRALSYYSFIEPARQLRDRPDIRGYVKEQMLYGIPNNAIGYLVARLLQGAPQILSGNLKGFQHFVEALSLDGLSDIAQTYVGFNASNWARQVVALDEGLALRSRYFFSIYATFVSHYVAALFIESSANPGAVDPLYRQGLAGMLAIYPFLSQHIKVAYGEPFVFGAFLTRSEREALESDPSKIGEIQDRYRVKAVGLLEQFHAADGSRKSELRRELYLVESRLKWLKSLSVGEYRFSAMRQFLRVLFSRARLPDFSIFEAPLRATRESIANGLRRHGRATYIAALNYASSMIVLFWMLRWIGVGEPGQFEGLYQHAAHWLAEYLQTPQDILNLTTQLGVVNEEIARSVVQNP